MGRICDLGVSIREGKDSGGEVLRRMSGWTRSVLLGVCIIGLTLVFIMGDSSPAMAHRVNVFAWVEGDTIYVESKFPGGRKVKDGQILVFDKEGSQLLEGTTNDEGEFSFKVPKEADLTIVLKAGMGHQAKWVVPAAEILEAAGEVGVELAEPPMELPIEETFPDEEESEIEPSDQLGPRLTEAEVRRIVEEALDRKLEPMKKMLVESQETGPTVTEIVGGIGYIFGLLGVAAYLMSRRKGGSS